MMSDTKDASNTSKAKGGNCLFAFGFFFLLQFHAAGGTFFLVVSENIAAISASFLQAVLLWGVSS
jgi:hypothetical protein